MTASTSTEQALTPTAEKLLADLIDRRWPGTKVLACTPVAGDASSRHYLRVTLSGPKAPDTLIAMLMEDAAIALSSDELGVFGKDGPDELPFLNVARFLAEKTAAIPETYAFAEDNTVVLLEDLGDTTLWDAAHRTGADAEALFGDAIELITQLQRSAIDGGEGCYAFLQSFDVKLFSWEFEHFLEYGVATKPAAVKPAAGQELLGASRRELLTIAETLGALPKVFSHRDFHAWNLHVCSGRIRFFDFQDALLAPAVYDIASLLTDRMTPELIDPGMEQRLVAKFHRLAHCTQSADETLRLYRLVALQRVLKVVGRFNYLSDIKGKPAYREMLPAVVATARRLLESFDNLPATTELLTSFVRDGSEGS